MMLDESNASLRSAWAHRSAKNGSSALLVCDRSRGHCLEMICADFLAGANLDNEDPETLLFSMTRFFKFLPGAQREAFLGGLSENAS